jgi:hypothetical protein
VPICKSRVPFLYGVARVADTLSAAAIVVAMMLLVRLTSRTDRPTPPFNRFDGRPEVAHDGKTAMAGEAAPAPGVVG